jgi:hypothetical protein
LQDHLVGYGVLVLFYGGLFYWLYRFVRRNIHPSRSMIWGYLGSLAAGVGLLFALGLVVAVLMVLTGSPRPNGALAGAAIGAVVLSIFYGWVLLCKRWLSRPRS